MALHLLSKNEQFKHVVI